MKRSLLLVHVSVAQTDFEAIRARAEAGDVLAQLILGIMYEIGEGVVENDQEAVKWYRMAAEQGDADAQYGLGGMPALAR